MSHDEELLLPPFTGPLAGLGALDHPPSALRVRGELRDGRRVAIVGTRRASDDGQRFTRLLARDLAAVGAVILSGGAAGIDAAAHRGALAAGGATWAVLPTGFSPAYPRRHTRLFATIAQTGGALLSELADGTPAAKFRFLHRNRLVAALAEVVILVDVPERSGALDTAAHARRLGRPVLVAPVPPLETHFVGSHRLLVEGFPPCMSTRSVLRALGEAEPEPSILAERGRAGGTRRRPPRRPRLDEWVEEHARSESERRVLEALRAAPLLHEFLSLASGLDEDTLEDILDALTERRAVRFREGRFELAL